MPLTLYFDDNFTNSPVSGSRSLSYPTTPGGAGSTTGVGNGWIDVPGSTWDIDSSNVLHAIYSAISGNSFTSAFLDRPSGESHLAQQVSITVPAGGIQGVGSASIIGACLRVQPNGDRFFVHLTNTGVSGYYLSSGGTSVNGCGSLALDGVSFSPSKVYQLVVTAPDPVAGSTTLTAVINDITDGGTVPTTGSFSAVSDSNLQSAGSTGLVAWTGSGTTDGLVSHFQAYQGDSSTSMTISPTSVGASSTGNSLLLTLSTGTFAGAPTASAGTITAHSSTGSSTITLTYTAPAGGPVTFTDGGSGDTATLTISTGSVALSPTTFPMGVLTAATLTGTGTSWNGTTKPTISGGAGAYPSNISVSGQVISFNVNPGSTAGTLTIGDSVDGLTATGTATSSPFGNIFFHGDSLTYGVNGSNPGTTSATRIATVAAGLGPGWTVGASGGPGAQITQFSPSTASAAYDAGATYNILIVQGSHNDIFNGANLATLQSRVIAYNEGVLALNAGWKIIWCTGLPAADAPYPANFDIQNAAFNAWLRSAWRAIPGMAAISDVAEDFRIGLPGSEYNQAYFGSDFTHPIDAGYAIWGGYDLAAALSVVGSGSLAGGGGGSYSFVA